MCSTFELPQQYFENGLSPTNQDKPSKAWERGEEMSHFMHAYLFDSYFGWSAFPRHVHVCVAH